MPPTPEHIKIRQSLTINFLLIIMIVSISACAETGEHYPETTFFSKDITIIDIRTKPEWHQTGIVKGSKTITFFDAAGEYDYNNFLRQLNQVIDKNEEFAIICRSGARTRVAAQLLTQNGYKVIDLKGGVQYLPKIGIELVPYQATE